MVRIYGKLKAFGGDGDLLASFSDNARTADPRGLGTDGTMLFLNIGSNRILAFDDKGGVVRESGSCSSAASVRLELRTDAVAIIREYDQVDGRLVRVLAPDRGNGFTKPLGLRFGPDGKLHCVAYDEVVVFDFVNGKSLGAVVRLSGPSGHAVIFLG
jgi:hypothetical protein